MGTWGKGNFDDDTAADHLSTITTRLVDEIAKAMAGSSVEIEPDEYWGVAIPCNLELLHLIGKQGWTGTALPDAETIEAWKAKFLEVWDEEIDGLEPTRAYKKGRREELVRTFDQLAALASDETTAITARPAKVAAPKAKAAPKKKAAPAQKKAAPAKKKAAPKKKAPARKR